MANGRIRGWKPLRSLELHPAAEIFQYGQGIIEGSKRTDGLTVESRFFARATTPSAL